MSELYGLPVVRSRAVEFGQMMFIGATGGARPAVVVGTHSRHLELARREGRRIVVEGLRGWLTPDLAEYYRKREEADALLDRLAGP